MKTFAIALGMLLPLSLALFDARGAKAQELPREAMPKLRHAIEITPMMPFFGIYSLQYGYRMTPYDELLAGAAYTNIELVKLGKTHAPTLIAGYRRYLWRDLHLEGQLWPSYDNFHYYPENTYYAGFDLYGELRLGYKFDLHVAGLPAFVNLQLVYGSGIYAQNKPVALLEAAAKEPPFIVPVIFFGYRF